MTALTDTNGSQTTKAATWKIDSDASQVGFSARMRLMFITMITVKGRFTDVNGTFIRDANDPTTAEISVSIGAASVDTRSAARDKHLRSADFFDAEHYPQLTFTSRRIEALDQAKGHYRVTGVLTIRGVSREVSLDARETSPADSLQNRRMVDLQTMVDRRDFGIVWSRPAHKIADEVQLTLHIELVPAP